MIWRVLLLVVFIGAVVGSTTVYCGGCTQSGGVQVTGPAGFHVACFDVNGKPYINAIGTEWKGDIDGVFTFTMDTGLKARVHGDRCLVEDVSAASWAEIHKPAPSPTPAPTPLPPAPTPLPPVPAGSPTNKK